MTDEKTSAIIKQFPVSRSLVYKWFTVYRNKKLQYGDHRAHNWLVTQVPEQHHQQIHRLWNAFDKNRKRKK